MFGFFKNFGKPKSRTQEIKKQVILGLFKVITAVGERANARDLKEVSEKMCQDWLPLLPEDAINNCLPQVLAAYALVAQSQISVSNKNSTNAALLISAAKFCVADVAEFDGFDDLGVMRAAAKIAQDNGLDFYSSVLDAA